MQTTMREANDRGFDCLLVSDATASYTPAFKKATLEMVVSQVPRQQSACCVPAASQCCSAVLPG